MSGFVSNIKRQVGWFVILGLGTIIIILMMASLRSDLFANKFQLYFSPPSAAPFYSGQAVKFQGFTIGRVDDLELQDAGQVRVTMDLLERYRPMLHQGSYVHLVREGLIGEQMLEITAGLPDQPIVQDKQQIGYETAASVEQLLQDVKPAVENANRLLRELAELATWLNDPNSDIRQFTTRMNQVSQDLNRENIGKLVDNLTDVLNNLHDITTQMKDQRVAERLADSLTVTSEILADLRPLSEQIGREGPDSLKRINSLIGHVNQLSKSLDIVASDLSELTPELPGLARESRQTIAEMQDVLKKMQGSWLLGSDGKTVQEEDAIVNPVLEMGP